MNNDINANIHVLGPLPHLRCICPLPSWSSTPPDEIAHVPLQDSELCQRHLHIQHFQEISENTPTFSFHNFHNLNPIQCFAAWMTIKNLTNLSAFYPVGTFLHMLKYWVGLNQSNFCDNFLFLCKSGAFLYVRFTDEFLDNFSKQQCSQLRHPGLDGRSPEKEFVLASSVKAYCASH